MVPSPLVEGAISKRFGKHRQLEDGYFIGVHARITMSSADSSGGDSQIGPTSGVHMYIFIHSHLSFDLDVFTLANPCTRTPFSGFRHLSSDWSVTCPHRFLVRSDPHANMGTGDAGADYDLLPGPQ